MGKVTPLTLGSTIVADSGLPFVTTLRRDTPAFVGLPGATRMSALVWLLLPMLAAHSPDGSLSLKCVQGCTLFEASSLFPTVVYFAQFHFVVRIPVYHVTLALGNLQTRIASNVFVVPPCTAPLFLLVGCDGEM